MIEKLKSRKLWVLLLMVAAECGAAFMGMRIPSEVWYLAIGYMGSQGLVDAARHIGAGAAKKDQAAVVAGVVQAVSEVVKEMEAAPAPAPQATAAVTISMNEPVAAKIDPAILDVPAAAPVAVKPGLTLVVDPPKPGRARKPKNTEQV